MEYHKILIRQIRKSFGRNPELNAETKKLLGLINDTYSHFESDRTLLERSMEISSGELVESNNKLKKKQHYLEVAFQKLHLQKDEISRQNTEISNQSQELQIQKNNLEEINKAVVAKNDEIETLAENLKIVNINVTKKNKYLTDSISYAKNIQDAILPEKEILSKYFRNHFVIYRPKDIVSGDFYWFSHVENKSFIATIDCTGHGVPGAFMSIIGYSILNKIVNELKIFEPNEILNILNKTINSFLKQEESNNKDGMDLSLCRIENNKDDSVKLIFSGAKSNMYFIDKDQKEIQILKGDRYTIGGFSKSEKMFTNKEIRFLKGQIIYFTTDGFIDQNNPERKRLGTKKFLEMLQKTVIIPFDYQRTFLENELNTYQNTADQRDDITVIGLQL